MEDHFKYLENMYLNAPVNKMIYSGTSISIETGISEITWNIEAGFYHALGGLHGSAYFKLLDDAAFFAVQSEVKDYFILTTSFHVHFLRPVRTGQIRAKGTVLFRSKQLFTAISFLHF